MTSIRNLLLAAIKSVLKGKTFLEALFAFWISPSTLSSTENGTNKQSQPRRTTQNFLDEAERILLQPFKNSRLKDLAHGLKSQFKDGLLKDPACMLPSYNHQMPGGIEVGQYLSLDVGGSTLRIALIELNGRSAQGRETKIISTSSHKITTDIKALQGMAFFDWMAAKIVETIADEVQTEHSPEKPLPMGLAWSFPIEQTSLQSGFLQRMGKGFLADKGLIGRDLGDLVQTASRNKGLHLELAAIINDSTAALLSEAYVRSSTRFGLILGTGVNIAVHLPVGSIGKAKFGVRPASWFDTASHVVVNTELGMFGKDILPLTRWDEALNDAHPRPDFQPLEYLVSGAYLGEMVRLALVEAIGSTGILGGVVPPDLLMPYTLDTETISIIETDTSMTLERAIATFSSRHPSTTTPAVSDIMFLRTLSSFISRRSAAIVAASVFGLWQFKIEAEEAFLNSLLQSGDESISDPDQISKFVEETRLEMSLAQSKVGFNGSVIEQYPNYLANCQKHINDLVSSETSAAAAISIDLVPAQESTLVGAAVALACVKAGKAN